MNMLQKLKLKALISKIQKFHDMREKGVNIDLKDEITSQLQLAKFYQEHLYDKDVPDAAIYVLECYRAAASLGDVHSQYICGQRQFEKGRFWENFSTGIYGHPVHKKYATACYDEAFIYLKEAENNGHPLAKRLHGLALIKGFGVPKDLEKGFSLVVDSIEQENAWNRATQIFEELGLNTPEFFSLLISHKNKKING